MTDRKLLILCAGGLLAVGSLLWTVVLTVGPISNRTSGTPTSAPATPVQGSVPTLGPTNSSGVTTVVDNPANKLKRAQQYLEPPLSRNSINAAKLIIDNIPASTAEYKQGQKLLKEAAARLRSDEAAEAVRLRDTLQADYQRLLSEANPHLNYIKTSERL